MFFVLRLFFIDFDVAKLRYLELSSKFLLIIGKYTYYL